MNTQNIARLIQIAGRCLGTLLVTIGAYFLMLHPADASSICRWVDENGLVQFSDIVPDRYTAVVTCIHTQPLEPTTEQREAGKRAKDRRDKTRPPAQAASSTVSPQVTAPQPAVKQPAEAITDSTDCKTWQRLYDESGACFAPFRTAHGGIKAQAFDKCNEVPSPEVKCGPPRN